MIAHIVTRRAALRDFGAVRNGNAQLPQEMRFLIRDPAHGFIQQFVGKKLRLSQRKKIYMSTIVVFGGRHHDNAGFVMADSEQQVTKSAQKFLCLHLTAGAQFLHDGDRWRRLICTKSVCGGHRDRDAPPTPVTFDPVDIVGAVSASEDHRVKAASSEIPQALQDARNA
ncbi:hypothetical protein [Puniceibacterium sediminis]|uniref:hypothetical protein n=1 Tax=Puniceibacterium sediminis TaxID=1608407 RepID=UPI0011322B3F|nr:hypothetical protein [Puniceibacterium sediminis]